MDKRKGEKEALSQGEVIKLCNALAKKYGVHPLDP